MFGSRSRYALYVCRKKATELQALGSGAAIVTSTKQYDLNQRFLATLWPKTGTRALEHWLFPSS